MYAICSPDHNEPSVLFVVPIVGFASAALVRAAQLKKLGVKISAGSTGQNVDRVVVQAGQSARLADLLRGPGPSRRCITSARSPSPGTPPRFAPVPAPASWSACGHTGIGAPTINPNQSLINKLPSIVYAPVCRKCEYEGHSVAALARVAARAAARLRQQV